MPVTSDAGPIDVKATLSERLRGAGLQVNGEAIVSNDKWDEQVFLIGETVSHEKDIAALHRRSSTQTVQAGTTIGIDLGDVWSHYCTLNEAGEVVDRGRFRTSRSTTEHTILTQEQAMAILSHLKEPVRTMAWLDATTGLRVSELLALRWHDIDFESGVMHVQRGIVYGVVGDTKSNASKSRIPLAASVLNSLEQWRRETPYAAPADWVFASPRTKGQRPYWGNTLVARHLRVAAENAGIGPVGWHTFRRSISTWMIDNDENVKVTQELMRHANSKTTLDLYAKAATPSKRRAHRRIVDGLLAAAKSTLTPDGIADRAEFANLG